MCCAYARIGENIWIMPGAPVYAWEFGELGRA